MDPIYYIKQVIEKSYEHSQDIFMLFIDYQQAYDSIVREELWI